MKLIPNIIKNKIMKNPKTIYILILPLFSINIHTKNYSKKGSDTINYLVLFKMISATALPEKIVPIINSEIVEIIFGKLCNPL